ncbi:hypothetical protein REISMN_07325 [Rickettsia tamurae subsp. buchneri]|uniref:Uncharacterized protein n=1 Tax=Rickettsia tamurae subsp. buchneri TaxID=1462938 RepID=A0A8E1BZJ0_9RICK|nr:hypothetical protein REISMN_07325 [Rickettsia tamurae subsp. buchneri]
MAACLYNIQNTNLDQRCGGEESLLIGVAFINAPIIFILSLILTLSLSTTILAFSTSGSSLLIGFNSDCPDTTLTSFVLTLRFSTASARFCACSCNNLSIVCKRTSLDKVLSSTKEPSAIS